LIDKNIKLIWS